MPKAVIITMLKTAGNATEAADASVAVIANDVGNMVAINTANKTILLARSTASITSLIIALFLNMEITVFFSASVRFPELIFLSKSFVPGSFFETFNSFLKLSVHFLMSGFFSNRNLYLLYDTINFFAEKKALTQLNPMVTLSNILIHVR